MSHSRMSALEHGRKDAKTVVFVVLLAITFNGVAIFGLPGNVQSACAFTGKESITEQDRIVDAVFSNGDLLEAFRCGQLLSSRPASEGCPPSRDEPAFAPPPRSAPHLRSDPSPGG
jgi:hypothetical protein